MVVKARFPTKTSCFWPVGAAVVGGGAGKEGGGANMVDD